MLRSKVHLFGTSFHPWSEHETILQIERRMDSGEFTQHAVVNVAKLVNMQSDTELRELVEACDIVNVDGMGVVWGARFAGVNLPERVTGIDLFFSLLQLAQTRNEGVFLLGATADVLDAAVDNIRALYPQLEIAGFHHGYYWQDAGGEERIVKQIHDSGARWLFVAMSSPLKERFIDRWSTDLGVGFAMGIGGSLDIAAGKTPRAPVWMQRIGMEWFYRLWQEPRRMWRRYLVTNFRFALMCLRARK